MARRLRLVLLASVLALSVPVGARASTLRTLTVRGIPNAFTEVTFAAPVRFETSGATKAPPIFDAEGTYAAVYVEPVRGTGPVAGSVLLRGMPGLSDLPFSLAPQGWQPAGRYRIHLLGDAPTVVKIRVVGLRRDLTVSTWTRAAVVATWIERGVAGIPSPVDRAIVPFTVRPRTLTVLAEIHDSTGFYGRRDVCVRPRSNGLTPCLTGNSGRGWYWGVHPVNWQLGGASAFHPGELPLGDHEVEFFDMTAGVPNGHTTFVMTVN